MSDTVEITREEYARLLDCAQELEDLRAFDAGKASLTDGSDELIPSDYAKRLVEGESPLRVFRQLRKLTQAALSEKAGVSRVVICEIETGTAKGSITTNMKLADALGVAIDDLV